MKICLISKRFSSLSRLILRGLTATSAEKLSKENHQVLKTIKMNIGSAIKSIRRKLSITQYELAEKCELSQTSLSQIETGVKRPSQRTINKVCNVLDIPESILYIVAMQEADVPPSKKGVYELVYPSIKSLALQMVSSEHMGLVATA